LPEGVGAGNDVAEALGFVVEERHADCKSSEGHVDLQEPEQPADEGVPEADGPAVVADNAQPCCELSERAPAGEGLNGDGTTTTEKIMLLRTRAWMAESSRSREAPR
jgi:hypothetical protein